MSPQNKAIPALDWPDGITEQQKFAGDVVAAINAGSTGIVTTAAAAAIAAAKIAEDAVATKAPGTTKTRNDKFAIMKSEIEKLMDKVLEATDGLSLDAAEALILANGFHLKGHAVVSKEQFEVRNGSVSGTVDLIAKARRVKSAHDWWISYDKGMTWIPLTPTLQAKTKVEGLTRGQIVFFRHRTILKDGPTDWDYDDVVVL